ncbi:hypothetical protein M758_UG099500 [Ceratodon purpureus]|nr:hypothetical protein M758_UG099500 [Ceratodon purpureus]
MCVRKMHQTCHGLNSETCMELSYPTQENPFQMRDISGGSSIGLRHLHLVRVKILKECLQNCIVFSTILNSSNLPATNVVSMGALALTFRGRVRIWLKAY